MKWNDAKKLMLLMAALSGGCGQGDQTSASSVGLVDRATDTSEPLVEQVDAPGDRAVQFDIDYPTAWAKVDERIQATGQPHTLLETARGPLIVPYIESEGQAVFGGDVVLGEAREVAAWQRRGGPVRGVAFNNVWFSDGRVRWWTDVPSQNGLGTAGINAANSAGDFLNSRTPVDVARVTDKSDSNLELKLKGLVNVPGGSTWMYWISWTNPLISFSDDPSRGTVLHEMGHALGFAHEFQRVDRDAFVDLADCATIDSFNFGKVTGAWKGTNTADNLSPYDYGSVMDDGYGCVERTGSNPVSTISYRGLNNPESMHDINSLYRMYADPLGSSSVTKRFGHATASGDFDDDGYPDFVVAATLPQSATGQYASVLYFYRGVELDPSEDTLQYRWMPWFYYQLEIAPEDDLQVELAVGDFNGDGIDDLAAGLPWANNDMGKVKLLFVNKVPDSAADDETRWAPWGRKGVRQVVTLDAERFGLSSQNDLRLGASLAAGKLSKGATVRGDGNYDDLLIGAPGYFFQAAPRLPTTYGAVVHLRGTNDETPEDSDFSTYQVIKNQQGRDIGFGKSVATIANYCVVTSGDDKDGFVVGAPQGGAAYVYGCASSTTGALMMPSRLASLTDSASAMFGFSVEGTSLRRQENGVWGSKFYVMVGAPKFESNGKKVGRVSLYDISKTGAVNSTRSMTPSSANDGAAFGHAVKARQRSDSTSNAPINDLMLAIGSPGMNVGNVNAGKVYLWQPFNADGSNHSTALLREPSSPDADQRYGDSISVIGHRRNFEHAGFVVGSPASRELFVATNYTAGSVDLLLDNDTDSHEWETRRMHINADTRGDRAPN